MLRQARRPGRAPQNRCLKIAKATDAATSPEAGAGPTKSVPENAKATDAATSPEAGEVLCGTPALVIHSLWSGSGGWDASAGH